MNINGSTIWEVLGIAPTTDKKEVKKAYAKAVKQCHPEEDPEAFQILYKAYQAALNNCLANARNQQQSISRPDFPSNEKGRSQKDNSELEDNDAFEKARQLFAQIPHKKGLEEEKQQDSFNKEVKPKPSTQDDKKYQELFNKNSYRQQEAIACWEFFWKHYLANPSEQNRLALIQFFYGDTFSLIRDLDSVLDSMVVILTKKMTDIPKDFVYTLWDVYDFRHYDAQSDQTPYDSGYRKLYKILKRQCDSYIEMAAFGKRGKIAKWEKRISFAGLFLLIVVVSFGLTIRTAKINKERYPNRMEVHGQVIDIICEKYPEFLITGWSLPPDNTERVYEIGAKASLRGVQGIEKNLHVTVVDDGKGNMVSYSDDFEKSSIQLLASRLGLHCQVSLDDDSNKRSITITFEKDKKLGEEIENVYVLLASDTVKNLHMSYITFCETDTAAEITYTLSNLPDKSVLIAEIYEGMEKGIIRKIKRKSMWLSFLCADPCR